MEWYYILGAIAYGLFIVQGLLSLCGSEFDLDFDMETDFDMGDLFSFKGGLHFLMGFSGWLMLNDTIKNHVGWLEIGVGLLIGFLFVVLLYYLYKVVYKFLEDNHKILTKEDCVGLNATVYLNYGYNPDLDAFVYDATVHHSSGTHELRVYSKTANLEKGEDAIIQEYKDNKLFI